MGKASFLFGALGRGMVLRSNLLVLGCCRFRDASKGHGYFVWLYSGGSSDFMRAPDDEMTYHEQELPQNNAGEKFRNSSFILFTSAYLPSCQFEQSFKDLHSHLLLPQMEQSCRWRDEWLRFTFYTKICIRTFDSQASLLFNIWKVELEESFLSHYPPRQLWN